jgi:hypothetical protein
VAVLRGKWLVGFKMVHWGQGDAVHVTYGCFLSPGVHAKDHLVQWGKGVLVPSQMFSLTYATYTLSVSEYSVSWVQLQPEKDLEWIGVICTKGSTNYSSILQSRVIISRETNKNQVFL